MADEEKKTTEEQPKEAVEETTSETPSKTEGKEAETTEKTEPPSAEATGDKEEDPVEVEEVKPEEAQQKIETGMVVKVHVKIKDVTPRGDERERIQVFEGTVIAKKGKDVQSATITVRKISNGIGVERIFPLKMPAIEKIEIVKQFRTRRSKLYFLRGKYKKRIKEVPIEKK
ncbi:MAG: 50S ribosomal protein L19 [Patescibacteria group bacterium]|nr:50S ribosomal protein L19 [Patescibacteria group bacterium]